MIFPVRRPSLSERDFHRLTTVVLVLLVLIVVTGAAVRLTGSGLGCRTWPNCEKGHFVAPWERHAMVEFVNRLITGLVSLAVIVAVLGSLVRAPRRRDLIWLSIGLVVGVIGQIVLGGIVVLFDLNPVLVQGHFILSMALVADAVVLHHRAGESDGHRRPVVTPALHRLGAALVVLAGLVIVTGTVVTGSGPHAGDVEAKRLPFTLHSAARVHGTAMILFLGATLVAMWRMRSERAPATVAAIGRGAAVRARHAGRGGLHAVLHRDPASARRPARPRRRARVDRGAAPRGSGCPLPRRGCETGAMSSTPVEAPTEIPSPTDEIDVTPDRPWIVLVWNDPINLMSYVTFVFQKLFGYSLEKATSLMLDVHEKGRAVVSNGPREKAEVDVLRLHEHGLWATMQQDD